MKYYLEIDGKIEENITKDEFTIKLSHIKQIMEVEGFKHLRVQIKENPNYDSFGNLWD